MTLNSNPLFEPLERRQLLAASVTALVLVDADTGKDIQPLHDRIVLNLAALPTRHLNVRADTSPDARSVRFGFDGKSTYRIENYLPYSLGANDAQGGYLPWTPTVGQHTLSTTAYTQRRGGGRGGATTTLLLTVTDAPAASGVVTPEPTPVIAPDPGPMPGPIDIGPQPVISPDTGGDPGPFDIGPSPPIAGAWSLVFADEFNATTVSNAWVNKIWGLTQVPGEAQTYSPSAVTTAGGAVSLTATDQPLGGRAYTSGVLSTGGIPGKTPPGFSFTYGYVEARIKMAPGNGIWSAFWMLPTPYADGTIHDDDGELDVVEFVGPQPTVGNAAAHRGGVNRVHDYDLGTDLTQGFHTYGLDWEPDHLTWFVDGNVVFTTNDTAVIPTVAEYLILNLSVGVARSWPGTPDATTSFPASMQVDYVHVWQKGA